MAQQLKTDWILFLTVVVMVASGILIVYSASSVMAQMNPNLHDSWHYVRRQAAWGGIAIAVMMILKNTYYRKLQNPAVALSVISFSLLLLLMGLVLDPVNRRWIQVGPINVQPAELATPAPVI